jgi:ankyrin repeat protein
MLKIGFGELRFVLTCFQYGYTPLHHGCCEGHVTVVTVLLTAGASIEVQNQVRSEKGSTRVVLISFVQEGETPLHIACAHGAVGVVSELLAAGAQMEALDSMSELESVMCGCLTTD